MFCIPGQGLHHSGGLLHLLRGVLWHGGGATVRGSDGNCGHREVLQRYRPGPAYGGHCCAGGATWCRSVMTKPLIQHPVQSLVTHLKSRVYLDKIKSKGLRITPLSVPVNTLPLSFVSDFFKDCCSSLESQGSRWKISSRWLSTSLPGCSSLNSLPIWIKSRSVTVHSII